MGQVEVSILKKLKQNETDLRWDEYGKHIVMPEAWWKKTIKVSAINAEVASFFPFYNIAIN
jgi:hypothetical protein